MAVDPNIAMGFRGIELANPLAQYGQVAAIQNAQNQNALAQFQLGAAQRAEAKDIGRTNALAQAGTNDDAIANALLKAGDLEGYTKFIKTKRETQKADVDLADAKLKQSRLFLENVTTPEQYIAWHEANHKDPILGPMLAARGVTAEQSRARIMDAIAKGPAAFTQLVNESKLGTEKFMELNKPQYITENLGGTSKISALPGLGGAPTTVSTTKKTATPGELMVDARARERLAAETATGVLTPESLDLAANLYNQTGTLPPLGIGKGAANIKAQIMNKATQLSMGGNAPASASDAAANLVNAKQDVASRSKAVKDFSTGKQGQQVNAFNTAIDHLGTMDKLSDALANGDVKGINALGNEVAKQTGAPAPTNFNAAKQIVTAEVIKAVVASGGGVTERQEAERNFSNANSPAQLKGVINTYKQLLGGQLKSLNLQYENTTGRKDFEKKLTPDAKAELSKLRGAEAPAAGVDLSNPLLAK
jgi:hypothetical protein